ncbi:Hypothetical predicted protein, partial [Pelobates cultripes]
MQREKRAESNTLSSQIPEKDAVGRSGPKFPMAQSLLQPETLSSRPAQLLVELLPERHPAAKCRGKTESRALEDRQSQVSYSLRHRDLVPPGSLRPAVPQVAHVHPNSLDHGRTQRCPMWLLPIRQSDAMFR